MDGQPMAREVMRYFKDIFRSNGTNASLFNRVQSGVTDSMNTKLLQPFTMDEVKAALFSMAPEKAPGPDGMTPSFYQHFWPIVGQDLSTFVINCLSSCTIPQGLNETNVVLIPKKEGS